MDTNLRGVRLLKGGVHIKKTTRRKYTDGFKDETGKLQAKHKDPKNHPVAQNKKIRHRGTESATTGHFPGYPTCLF